MKKLLIVLVTLGSISSFASNSWNNHWVTLENPVNQETNMNYSFPGGKEYESYKSICVAEGFSDYVDGSIERSAYTVKGVIVNAKGEAVGIGITFFVKNITCF